MAPELNEAQERYLKVWRVVENVVVDREDCERIMRLVAKYGTEELLRGMRVQRESLREETH